MTDRIAQLKDSLQRVEALGHIDNEGLDYDSATEPAPSWTEIMSHWHEAIDELWGDVSVHASITSKGTRGECARTVVPYSGNIVTVCSPFPDGAFLKGHSQQTSIEMEERMLWIRTVITSMKVMSGLATVYASPLLALASARNAWKLAKEVNSLAAAYRCLNVAKAS